MQQFKTETLAVKNASINFVTSNIEYISMLQLDNNSDSAEACTFFFFNVQSTKIVTKNI